MRHAISAVCCLIVGLQVLIGVPLAVCFGFFWVMQHEGAGPLKIEIRLTNEHGPATASGDLTIPGELCSATVAGPGANPSCDEAAVSAILESRAEAGSLLIGTLFDQHVLAPCDDEFVAVLRRLTEQCGSPAAGHCGADMPGCEAAGQCPMQCPPECTPPCLEAAKSAISLPCAN
jgi:hypothetical protein